MVVGSLQCVRRRYPGHPIAYLFFDGTQISSCSTCADITIRKRLCYSVRYGGMLTLFDVPRLLTPIPSHDRAKNSSESSSKSLPPSLIRGRLLTNFCAQLHDRLPSHRTLRLGPEQVDGRHPNRSDRAAVSLCVSEASIFLPLPI